MHTFKFKKLAMNKSAVNRIKELRLARGWSLDHLAGLIVPRTTASQIHKLESGDRRLTQQWMERVAAALEVAPVDLLPGSMSSPAVRGLDHLVLEEAIVALEQYLADNKMVSLPRARASAIASLYEMALSEEGHKLINNPIVLEGVIRAAIRGSTSPKGA